MSGTNPESDPNHRRPYAVVTGNLNLVRCLGIAGVPVFCATSEANRIAFSSRYVSRSHKTPSPTLTPDDFVEALVRIGKEKLATKGVLFYDGDGDLIAISAHRDKLSEFYDFLMPDHALIETLLDKTRFSELSQKLGLNVPRTFQGNRDSLGDADFQDEDFPILVKPQTRVGWLDNSASWQYAQGGKAFSVASQMQLDDLLNNMRGFEGGMILQQLIPGPESQIYSYHAFIDEGGRVLSEYCGRKHSTFPLEFGRSAFIEVTDNPRLAELGRDYVRRIGVVGVVKLDFKLNERTDDFYLLEVNSRFSIWNWPGAVAGRNLPAVAYENLCGEPQSQTDTALRNVYWADGRAHRRSAMRLGNPRLNLFSYPGKTVVFNIWSLRDPLPFVVNAWDRIVNLFGRLLRRLSGRSNTMSN